MSKKLSLFGSKVNLPTSFALPTSFTLPAATPAIVGQLVTAVDSNHDGSLNLGEVQSGLLSFDARLNPVVQSPLLSRGFDLLDGDHTGSVSVTEVVTAATTVVTLLNSHMGQVQQAVNSFLQQDGWLV